MLLPEEGTGYLAALEALEQTGAPVYAADLARALGVSRASVSRALGRLCSQGLVCRRGKALHLTAAGREALDRDREKQRCFEVLLCRAGLSPAMARAEAARLKLAVSSEGYAALRDCMRKNGAL